jgi:hypothetical protein
MDFTGQFLPPPIESLTQFRKGGGRRETRPTRSVGKPPLRVRIQAWFPPDSGQELKETTLKQGHERAARFTWEDRAQRTLATYRRALEAR